jgi:hypothetical protein
VNSGLFSVAEDPIPNFSSQSREVKQAAKIALSNCADRLGFTARKKTSIGNAPYIDTGRLAGPTPVAFDVGANGGQSIAHVKRRCPNSRMPSYLGLSLPPSVYFFLGASAIRPRASVVDLNLR